MKKTFKNEIGITLIALVITIIILLILAGVTISALSGDNGILQNATKAKEQTEIANEIEQVKLSVIGALAKDNGGEITESNLEDELTNYIGTRNVDYELTGTGPFVVKYKDSGRNYMIDENGNVSEYVDILDDVKIGDYVNYKPDDVTTSYDKFGVTYSGDSNGNIGQDDTLKWRVLNINTDGTVDLISEKPISATVSFQGARGYNNCVYLLNDYCRTMYSNNSKGAIARSVNIEDIQEKMKVVDENTGKKAYENYISETGVSYKTGTYQYSNNVWYALQWKNDNGIKGESNQDKEIEYSSEEAAKTQEKNTLTVTQTYWYLSSSDVQSNFISANTRDISKSDSMYYELLCNNGTSYYWLASRFVNTSNPAFAIFGLRYVARGEINGSDLFYSNGYSAISSTYVRPLVSLQSNLIDIEAGYNETVGWSLK